MARSSERFITKPDCVIAKRLQANRGWLEPLTFVGELDLPRQDSTAEPTPGSEPGEQTLERAR